jgi:hypothetical protein
MTRIILFLFAFSFLSAKAQDVPYLERAVSLDASDKTIAEVLKSISGQTSVVFSYTRFNDQKKISINCYRKPLRTVLSQILSTSNCIYKAKGKYIVINCSDTPTSPAYSIVSGFVYSAADSTKVDRASIYVKKTKHSSITNEYGYFVISCPQTSPKILLSIAKESYYDTTVAIYNIKEASVVVYLHPKPAIKERVGIALQPIKSDSILAEKKYEIVPEHVKSDSILIEKIDSAIVKPDDFLKKFRARFQTFNINFKNITDTLFSRFAVSLIPYISTNHLLSINTVNKYSFNILAGYSKGVDVLEIGGILNVDGGDVKYFQLAGVGNVVSGNVSGSQVGGIFNINHQRTNGMQVAGIYNQTNRMNGLQLAGILNQSEKYCNGVQISGLINKADTMKGFQLAGFLNKAEYIRGVQMSGFINTAKKIHGVQLGFLNFSDTCSGAPIGFFSFVKKGYHKIGLEGDELSFGTLSFGSGSEYFHTIFLGGINLLHNDIWFYGYGIGSSFKISNKWLLSFDATARQLQSSAYPKISLNLLSRLFVGIEYSPFSKLRLGLGPSYNVMTADINGDQYSSVSKILPTQLLYNRTRNNVNVKTWIGGTFSVKFL